MYEWCKLSISFLKIYINLLCVECFDISEKSRLNERLHFRHTLYKFPHCSRVVTADTVADVYGLAAENAEEGEEVVYYLTGEFFGSAIEVPVGKTAADFKAPFRKIGIFLVDTDNATA